MAGFTLKLNGIKGVREYLARFPAVPGTPMHDALANALIDIGDEVTTKAAGKYILRGGSPGVVNSEMLTSRTGTLRRSISTVRRDIRRLAIESGSDLVYARPHELGYPEGNLPPRPFMGPALEDVMANDADRLIGAALAEVIR